MPSRPNTRSKPTAKIDHTMMRMVRLSRKSFCVQKGIASTTAAAQAEIATFWREVFMPASLDGKTVLADG
ncbi:hypothetical protein D9M72_616810 [compost metagenome]